MDDLILRKRTISFAVALLFGLMLNACLQPQVSGVPASTPTATVTPDLSSLSMTVTPAPTSVLAFPSETATPLPIMQGNGQSGSLILIDQRPYPEHQLARFDLNEQNTTTLFSPPPESWVFQADLNRAGDSLVMAYAAPPEAGQTAYDRNGVYTLPLTNGEMGEPTPEFLFGNTAANEFVFNPIWSADETEIFYVSYKRIPAENGAGDPVLDVGLMRYDVANGQHTLISKDGIWPRLSPDGSRLVFIQVDPVTTKRSVRTADLDGNNTEELVPFDRFFDIDTPHFSADGEWVYFGAVPHSTKVEATWWEKMLGIRVASAHTDHNVPSDWWRVSTAGGEPEKISSLLRIISHGTFDASGERLFFTTASGMYTLDPVGEVVERVPVPNVYQFVIVAP